MPTSGNYIVVEIASCIFKTIYILSDMVNMTNDGDVPTVIHRLPKLLKNVGSMSMHSFLASIHVCVHDICMSVYVLYGANLFSLAP